MPAAAPQAAAPKRSYSEYEKNQKLPVINEFRDFLEGPMQKIIDEGPRLASGWWNAIKDPKNNPTYNDDLQAFFKNLNSSPDRIETLRKKYHRHEEVCDRAQNEHVSREYEMAAHSIKLDAAAESFHVVMNPARSAFEDGLREFIDWRNKTLSQLSDLERDMTQP